MIWGHIGYTPCSQRLPSRNVFKHSESLFLVVLNVDSEILFSVCLFFFFFSTDFRPPLKTTFSANINGYYADLRKKEPNIAWSVFIDEGWLMLTAVSLSAQLRRNDWSWSVVYLLTIDRSWKQPEARNYQTSAFFELFLFWRCRVGPQRPSQLTTSSRSWNFLEQNNIW